MAKSPIQRYNKAIAALVTLIALVLAEFGVEAPAQGFWDALQVVVTTLIVYIVPNRSV